MKIRFNDSCAGANFSYRKGEIVDLRVDVAREFTKCGLAEEVKEDPIALPASEELAVRAAPEVAAKRAGGRRRNLRNLGGLL